VRQKWKARFATLLLVISERFYALLGMYWMCYSMGELLQLNIPVYAGVFEN
jgi:hypothetical protein